jgi:hypothetical protein
MLASLPIHRLHYLSKAGWIGLHFSRGLLRANGLADAHRDDGNSFVVRSEEKLTAFLELKRVTRESLRFQNAE